VMFGGIVDHHCLNFIFLILLEAGMMYKHPFSQCCSFIGQRSISGQLRSSCWWTLYYPESITIYIVALTSRLNMKKGSYFCLLSWFVTFMTNLHNLLIKYCKQHLNCNSGICVTVIDAKCGIYTRVLKFIFLLADL